VFFLNLNSFFSSIDISSRPKRRKAVNLIISTLHRIRSEEEAYRDRIPFNLSDSIAFANADDSIDFISDAILVLSDAY